MSAQMIQTNLNNGKAQAAQGKAFGFKGRMSWHEFVALIDELGAARRQQSKQ